MCRVFVFWAQLWPVVPNRWSAHCLKDREGGGFRVVAVLDTQSQAGCFSVYHHMKTINSWTSPITEHLPISAPPSCFLQKTALSKEQTKETGKSCSDWRMGWQKLVYDKGSKFQEIFFIITLIQSSVMNRSSVNFVKLPEIFQWQIPNKTEILITI